LVYDTHKNIFFWANLHITYKDAYKMQSLQARERACTHTHMI